MGSGILICLIVSIKSIIHELHFFIIIWIKSLEELLFNYSEEQSN